MRKAILQFVVALTLASSMPAQSLLDVGYNQMYNLEFDEAHKTFERFEQQSPGDPLGPVSNAAAFLFAEFDRLRILQAEFFVQDETTFKRSMKLTPDPKIKEAFYQEIGKAERAASAILSKYPQDRNALFASILNIGLRADYEGLIEKRYLSSLHGLKEGRLLAQKLLADDPTYYDAYLAIGVENYMLSLKPAPVRWMLQLAGAETDKEAGLQKLKMTADNGHYLKPYARLLIAVAALRDHDRGTAMRILSDLSKQFPHNRLYSEQLAHIQKLS
jgi:hypothetical protein